MDRAGWHGAKELVGPDTLTLGLLPARAPELNPVETIWPFLRDNGLSSRVFASYTDIVDPCRYALEPPHRPALDLADYEAVRGRLLPDLKRPHGRSRAQVPLRLPLPRKGQFKSAAV